MQMSASRAPTHNGSDGRGTSSVSDSKHELIRSGSEEWEVVQHADSACYSSHLSSGRGPGTDDSPSEARVCLTLQPLEHGGVAVRLTVAPTPSLPLQPAAVASPEGVFGNRSQLSSATVALSTDGSSCGGSPARSSQLSFEHLSDHFSPPSAHDEEDSPASLPDVDALHDNREGRSAVAVGDAPHDILSSGVLPQNSPSSDAPLPPSLSASLHAASDISDSSLENQSISPLGSSFSDVAANLAAVAGASPSVVDRAIARLQAGDYPWQIDEVGLEGGSVQNPQILPESSSSSGAPSSIGDKALLASDSNTSVASTAANKALHSASDKSVSEDDVPYYKSSLAALQAYLAEYVPPDSLAVRVPSEAIAAVWKLLQEWGCCTNIVMGHCLDALPPRVAAHVQRAHARARAATKHLRGDIGFLGAALGLSVTGLAVMSLLLARSYNNNWQLRVAVARKDDDIMKLVGQVVTLQRNMFRPQRVQVRHLSSSCAFPDLGAL